MPDRDPYAAVKSVCMREHSPRYDETPVDPDPPPVDIPGDAVHIVVVVGWVPHRPGTCPLAIGMLACYKRHAPHPVKRPVVGTSWLPHVPGSCPLAFTVMTEMSSTNGHGAQEGGGNT